jgi:chromosome partitioning protein
LAGVVISRVGRPAHHRSEIVTALRTQFPNHVLNATIQERVAVAEAASKQISVFQSNDSQAAAEFNDVYLELKVKIGV